MHATRRLAPALAVLVLAFAASPATAGDQWHESAAGRRCRHLINEQYGSGFN
jgi:hypothetical protein